MIYNKKHRGYFLTLLACVSSVYIACHADGASVKKDIDLDWTMSGVFRPEMFYGRNVSLLNNRNETDKLWYTRHILDFNFDLNYGKKTYDYNIGEFYFNLRSKSIWGNPNSIAPTTEIESRSLNAVVRGHKHYIPRHIMWIRELWFKFDLCPALGLSFDNDHTFMIGAFPFELGRGIALGDAYAVAPETLGFYTDAVVDQYAYGAKLSGVIVPEKLSYDFYMAILQNKASGLSDTAERIRGQHFGRLASPARGFGIVNFLVAGRFNWDVFDSIKLGRLHLEPYIMYNNDPEQRVDVIGDANSKLGTIGFACEYKNDMFEFGFDYAQNLGRQQVRGVDRNQIVQENRDGYVVEVNSQVLVGSSTGQTTPFIPGSPSQALINQSRADEALNAAKRTQNGQLIGITTIDGATVNLYNSPYRFRDPYTNTYKGFMFVTDAAVWLYKKDLQIAATAAIATGDENPHTILNDSEFTGFIPFQELYTGKRVKSIFVLGSAGKLKRPLSAPTAIEIPNPYATVVSGFTNLVFCGAGLTYRPQGVCKQYRINPNVLTFWQQRATKKFDILTKSDTKADARTFLGTEANLVFDYYLLKDLKIYAISSVFFPGTHYQDIRGKPLDREQDRALDSLDFTGFTNDQVPNIGTDVAYTFNLGLEFKF